MPTNSNIPQILAIIDEQLTRLEQVRSLLSEEEAPAPMVAPKQPGPKPGSKRTPMSAEARARIGAAQKKRWAKQKKG